MATKLFLRNTQTNGIGATYYDMVPTAGAAADTCVVNTVASGTEIQFTKTAGGAVAQWISGRVPAGGFTLTQVDISAWLQESNAQANCGGRFRIFKRAANGVETELGGGPFNDGVEFGTAAAEMLWIGNVTDTVFAENDRILLKLYITNIGTMGGARTCTLTFNAPDAATGDSFLNLAETVSFKAEDVPISGTLSKTLGAVTLSAAAKLDIKGSTAKTLGAIAAVSSSKLDIKGQLSKTLGSITLASSGLHLDPISGSLNQTLGSIVGSSSGKVAIVGSLSRTLGPVGSSSTGKLDIRGSLGRSLDPIILTASGTTQQVAVGQLSRTLGSISLVGAAKLGIVGSLSEMLGSLQLSSSGKLMIQGSVTSSLAPVGLSATSKVANRGVVAAALSPVSVVAAGSLQVQGSLVQSLGALTIFARGSGQPSGLVQGTLGPIISISSARLAIRGSVIVALDDIVVSSSGVIGLGELFGLGGGVLGSITLQSLGSLGPRVRLFSLSGSKASISLLGQWSGQSQFVIGQVSKVIQLQGQIPARTSLQGEAYDD